MKVSVKEKVDSAIKNFQEEFGKLDELEKTIDNISSVGVLEEISSTLGEFTYILQEIVDDTTVRIEELEPEEENEEEGDEDENPIFD